MAEEKETMMFDEPKFYELGYLLVPTLPDADLPEAMGKIIGSIERAGGVIVSSENPVARELAYTLSRRDQGKRSDYDRAFFGWVKFEVVAGKIHEIEEALKHDSNIIRHLLVLGERVMTIAKGRTFKPRQADAPLPADAKPLSEAEIDQEINQLIAATE